MENQTILSEKRCKESWCPGFQKKLFHDKRYGFVCQNAKMWKLTQVFINKDILTIRTID